jgi:hypothetical protein
MLDVGDWTEHRPASNFQHPVAVCGKVTPVNRSRLDSANTGISRSSELNAPARRIGRLNIGGATASLAAGR